MNLILIELIFTAYLTGLIWTIQAVHYPSFVYIDKIDYKNFQLFHMRRITYIVGPIMLLELIICLINTYQSNFDISFLFNLVLLLIIWISTVVWTVPLHKKLTDTKDTHIIKSLVKSNIIRTILWSSRLIILFFYLY